MSRQVGPPLTSTCVPGGFVFKRLFAIPGDERKFKRCKMIAFMPVFSCEREAAGQVSPGGFSATVGVRVGVSVKVGTGVGVSVAGRVADGVNVAVGGMDVRVGVADGTTGTFVGVV